MDNPQGEQANRPYIQFLFFSSLKVVNVKQTYDTCTLQKNKLIIIIIIIIGNKLFKIVFLFETTFIFPQHYLSHEACMVYSDSYWLNAYLLPFVGVSTPLALVPGTSYLWRLKIEILNANYAVRGWRIFSQITFS